MATSSAKDVGRIRQYMYALDAMPPFVNTVPSMNCSDPDVGAFILLIIARYALMIQGGTPMPSL
jgi:hypothetical protein